LKLQEKDNKKKSGNGEGRKSLSQVRRKESRKEKHVFERAGRKGDARIGGKSTSNVRQRREEYTASSE